MKSFKNIFFSCCVIVFITGCSSSSEIKPDLYSQLPANRLTVSHGSLAAHSLAKQAKRNLGLGASIIVASFVDIDDVTQSSALGRMLSQQFSSQFVHSKFKVVELLLRKNIYISEHNNGEFLLSRDVKKLSSQHQANALVVGTYAVGSDFVFVTAKVVDVTTNRILSAIDFSLPLDNNARNMLN